MTPVSSATQTGTARTPYLRRWIILGVASILLHLVAVNWAGGYIGLPSLSDQQPAIVTAALLPPPTPPAAALPKPVPTKRKARPRIRPAAPTNVAAAMPPPPAQQESVQETPADAVSTDGISVAAGTETSDSGIESINAAAAKATDSPTDKAADSAAIHYKVDPPPSAELKYDVQSLRDGETVYGHGKISWQSDGSNYAINGEAGILFFTVLNFKSEGAIDNFGVAPIIYSEKRFRKSETNTHFQRERNIISFSASTASYPRSGGEQDRASIIWQLAGIGRGDPEKFVPNTDINLFVAGVRDAESWNIHVIGEEDIELGSSKVHAWHLVRAPRAGSYEQKLDIWLAPQQQWYPVKLRYTERNGDYLDMSLSQIDPINPLSLRAEAAPSTEQK